MSLVNLTAKQKNDLNNMNMAAKRCELGTLVDTLISATINANVAMTATALTTATGNVTLTLSEAITGLAIGDFTIKANGVALTATTHFTTASLSGTAPVITFKTAAAIDSDTELTIYIAKTGYFVNYGEELEIVNEIA